MTIYEKVVERVCKGAPFHVDLLHHTVSVDKREVDMSSCELGLSEIETEQQAHDYLVMLHREFMHSIPNEAEQSLERRYWFRAPRELSREDVLYGLQRAECRVRLELATLILIMKGLITWNRGCSGWFINLSNGLIIKKDWIWTSC